MPHLSRRFSGNAFLYIAIASIAAQAFIVLGQYLFPFFLGEHHTVLRLIFNLIIFLPPLILVSRQKRPVRQVLRLNSFSAFYIWYAIGIALCLFVFLRMFGLLVSSLLAATTHPEISYTYFSAVSPHLWPYILTSCLIPALLEEAAFRGIIQSSFHGVSPFKACFVTGVLYALVKRFGYNIPLSFNLINLIPGIIIGFVFGYFSIKTLSIIPSMIASFFYFLFYYIDFNDWFYAAVFSPLGIGENAATFVLAILAVFIGGVLLVKMPQTKHAPRPIKLLSPMQIRAKLRSFLDPDEEKAKVSDNEQYETTQIEKFDTDESKEMMFEDINEQNNSRFVAGSFILASILIILRILDLLNCF